MPRDAVSRTAYVGTVGTNGSSDGHSNRQLYAWSVLFFQSGAKCSPNFGLISWRKTFYFPSFFLAKHSVEKMVNNSFKLRSIFVNSLSWQFTDWFGTKLNAVLFQINRKKNHILFNLRRIKIDYTWRKDSNKFSEDFQLMLCTSKFCEHFRARCWKYFYYVLGNWGKHEWRNWIPFRRFWRHGFCISVSCQSQKRNRFIL